MRRRLPHLIELSDDDYSFVEQLVRDGRTEQRVAWSYSAVVITALCVSL
jgi:hypothetical protein